VTVSLTDWFLSSFESFVHDDDLSDLDNVENRGMRVNMSGECQKLMQKAARWPRGVCGRGVGSNSIQCTSCQK